ncbi:hypothetical protein J8273_5554 [Carpediemonas membranifera]|uniref:Uncharacterized protein n=1 Tax=Carpediemonas membranifera TaxID=201153 RepID=A0A8J6B423_9EUKA|nr:hypothetical protein J8273_5554 [Carpediemonas membranifera]|eukprot:KAG9392549.1 hypothetical protein J8273_5554 [Carpediemonas membranifera]
MSYNPRIKIGNWVEESFNDDYKLLAAKMLANHDDQYVSSYASSYTKPAVISTPQMHPEKNNAGSAPSYLLQGHGASPQAMQAQHRSMTTNDEAFGRREPRMSRRQKHAPEPHFMTVTQRDFGVAPPASKDARPQSSPVQELVKTRKEAELFYRRGVESSEIFGLPKYEARKPTHETLKTIGSEAQRMGLRTGHVAQVRTPFVRPGEKL